LQKPQPAGGKTPAFFIVLFSIDGD